MSTETERTVVTALIRPHMEAHVVQALHDLDEFPGFFITEARGQGRGKGVGGSYRTTEFDLTYHHFLHLQVICAASMASQVCEKIAAAAWTRRKGDGIVFTCPAYSFGRIREIGRRSEEAHHD